MLDTVQSDLLSAVKAWRPDAACIEAGDEHLTLALRCWAAAMLSDAQITDRLRAVASSFGCQRYDEAAIFVARHCAIAGAPYAEIIDVLVELAVIAPAWPDDPDWIAWVARSVIAESAS